MKAELKKSVKANTKSPGPVEPTYSIGDLAEAFSVSLRTLRFYEDRGLLHPKRIGTSRRYSTKDRNRLTMILKGKQLGFTLNEIQDLIGKGQQNFDKADLGLKAPQIIAQIEHLQRQRSEIDIAIDELRATQKRIQQNDARAA